MSAVQSGCKHPERCVIGHPFNPPHMIPLVEVVGGNKTSPEATQQAMAFYASVGKKPIYLRKEFPGHAANRLQAALYREVVYLIEQGVLSVQDADAVVSWGPGLRWGLMGPNLLWHIGGCEGGIHHFMETLMDPMFALMKDLGNPQMTTELKQTIIQGVMEEAGNHSVDKLAQEEHEVLLGLLNLRAKSAATSVSTKNGG
jgi:3-hydroxyacyl-CoA dehydrogenase